MNTLVNDRIGKVILGQHTLQKLCQSSISDGFAHERDNSINQTPLIMQKYEKLSDITI